MEGGDITLLLNQARVILDERVLLILYAGEEVDLEAENEGVDPDIEQQESQQPPLREEEQPPLI